MKIKLPFCRAKTTPMFLKAACVPNNILWLSIPANLFPLLTAVADSHPCHPRTSVNLPTQDGICEGGTHLDTSSYGKTPWTQELQILCSHPAIWNTIEVVKN